MSQQFAVWEVLFTAVISALTIAASVWLSRIATQQAIGRERDAIAREQTSERIERRANMMIVFSDHCADIVRRFRERDTGGVEDVARFTSRMLTYVDDDEKEALDWMRNVIFEVQKTGSEVYECLIGQEHERAWLEEYLESAPRRAAQLANNRFIDRVYELEGWVRGNSTFHEHLIAVGAKPVLKWHEREQLTFPGTNAV